MKKVLWKQLLAILILLVLFLLALTVLIFAFRLFILAIQGSYGFFIDLIIILLGGSLILYLLITFIKDLK